MLGANRPSVSLAAAALKQAGLIDYRRGQMTILDRAALEQAACECYALVTEEYEQATGASVRRRLDGDASTALGASASLGT